MIRIAFSIFLLLHGLLHLLGFHQAYRFVTVSQSSQQLRVPLSAKWLGLGWLLACVLFGITALLLAQRKDGWWLPGTVALLLSQVLILASWQEAKYGTLVNVIVFAALVLAAGSWQFQALVRHERQQFTAAATPEKKVVTTDLLRPLPPIVQQWLMRSNLVGKEAARTVHLKQKGEMKTAPEGKWWPVTADQYFTTDQPGFIWVADVKAAPFIHLAGRDKYQDGKGHMLIKLLSLVPVVNASGPEINQGTLLRYLAEIVWFPSAALQPYITWEQTGPAEARATMHYKSVSASGLFRFNPQGDVTSFEARRYFDRKEGATLETWVIAMEEQGYREFAGVRVPAKATVTWKLSTGDFTWYKLAITDITYNDR